MNYANAQCFGNSIFFPSIKAVKGSMLTYNFTLTDSCSGTHTISNIYVGDGLTYNVTQPILPDTEYAKGNRVPIILQISIPANSKGGTLHLFVNAT